MKETISKLLLQRIPDFVSGEELSQRTGVTRSAIWKHIQALKEEGYPIQGIPRRGYRLLALPDLLKQEVVEASLKDLLFIQEVMVFPELSSTNDFAKQWNKDGKETALFLADCQTAGRGRRGRSFASEKEVGLYMSFCFQPNCKSRELPLVTGVAAAAVVEALKNFDIRASIKWPNDILLQGKKVCGILTEMSLDFDGVSAVILGIGINVKNRDFPPELKEIATSLALQGYEVQRIQLLREVWREFGRLWAAFEGGEKEEILRLLRQHSAVLGKKIWVLKNQEILKAVAVDINDQGNLRVEYENGGMEELHSGEISLRIPEKE